MPRGGWEGYEQKGIGLLDQVLSDDALIITGRVIMQRHQVGFTTRKKVCYKHGRAESPRPKKRTDNRNIGWARGGGSAFFVPRCEGQCRRRGLASRPRAGSVEI